MSFKDTTAHGNVMLSEAKHLAAVTRDPSLHSG